MTSYTSDTTRDLELAWKGRTPVADASDGQTYVLDSFTRVDNIITAKNVKTMTPEEKALVYAHFIDHLEYAHRKLARDETLKVDMIFDNALKNLGQAVMLFNNNSYALKLATEIVEKKKPLDLNDEAAREEYNSLLLSQFNATLKNAEQSY